ncbi:hypothetical protein GRX03_14500 [Halovenus sp. WSH3]|uniref:Uncharacterized protein n=1 Tax=Halovenus carboxidivorans TaxID=2692199 RepID=A0A6B0TC56_9EURY|nr:hypothetical protein [Halovenus carboxidivorans]MXR52811.1 hypothetical protein [Halovenus carboxidivorans]
MSHHRGIDYGRWAKRGFLLGLGLLLLGAGGEIVGRLLVGTLPPWEDALFTYMEGIGLTIGFFSPWIFGVALPLTDG